MSNLNKTQNTNSNIDSNTLCIPRDKIPADCWILENKQFRFNDLERALPAIPRKYEKVLDALNLPYNVDDANNLLVFWNPHHEEYEKVAGKLYYKTPNGTYKYGKTYSGYIPSESMCEAAINLSDMVEDEISEYEHYHHIKQMLKGKVSNAILNTKKLHGKSACWNGHEIKIFSMPINSSTCIEVLFDATQIWKREYRVVILDLPENLKPYASRLAGKDCSRLGLWAAELGIDYIYVK